MFKNKAHQLLLTLVIISVLAAGCSVRFQAIGERLGLQRNEPTEAAAGDEDRSAFMQLQEISLLNPEQIITDDLLDYPRYTITVEIDPEKSAFSGQWMLEYQNLEADSLSNLNLRLFPNGGKSYGDGSLKVQNLKVNGIAASGKYSLDDSVLTVKLPSSVNPGEEILLSAELKGEIPQDFEGSGYGLYNQSDQVIALSGWFPILAVYDDEGWNLDPVSSIGDSVYSDAAFYDITVQAPAEYQVISTGVEIESLVDTDEKKEIRFASGPARDFFLILSPKFEVVQRLSDRVMINSYYLPGHKEGGQEAAEIAADSVQTFNQRYGPYPYTELDVVDAPMRYAAGIEFPGVILIGTEYYDQYQEVFFSVVTAHEVAHQWWYNVVGSDVIDEPWLDEALVTYSSNLYFQDHVSSTMYQQLIMYYREVVEQAEARGIDDPITESLAYFEETESRRSAYSPVVYTKGSLFFYQLREEIGDEAFFEALQSYYHENRFEIGTPEELLTAFEKSAGVDLSPFYQEWLDLE